MKKQRIIFFAYWTYKYFFFKYPVAVFQALKSISLPFNYF